jgi:hypothetical protein
MATPDAAFGKPFVHHETSKDRTSMDRRATEHASRVRSTPFTLPTAPASSAAHKLVPAYALEEEGAASRPQEEGGLIYTFTACVNGAPKLFDVLIRRGPY